MNSTRFKPLVILTGAGISAESGIRTFRASDGLWEDHRVEDVATPEGFARNPELVYRFYNARRAQLKDPNVQPNAAHIALAELEKNWEGDFLLVTQNVDDLHERAGSNRVIHMHGELKSALCSNCDSRSTWTDELDHNDTCVSCARTGSLRPDIVWFGEMPYQMEMIDRALQGCELFISIGTSGRVYPAAGFARQASRAHRIEVNLEKSDIAAAFHEHRLGPATIELPKLADSLLARS